MRIALLSGAVWLVATMSGHALDDDDPFIGYLHVEPKTVTILLGSEDRAWLNGKHIDASKDTVELAIRLGDTFIHAGGRNYYNKKPIDHRTFSYYRLDRIAGKKAWFTCKTYAVRSEPYGREGVRLYPDKLLFTKTIEAEDTMGVLDGGWGEYPGIQADPRRISSRSR